MSAGICPNCGERVEVEVDTCEVAGCSNHAEYETYATNGERYFLIRICGEHRDHPSLCANQHKTEEEKTQ